jgi:hypothetical protein
MATVKIYQFETYDIHTDQTKRSRRWGTLDGIENTKVATRVLRETETEVDASVVGKSVAGLTEIDFLPNGHAEIKRTMDPSFLSSSLRDAMRAGA